MGLTTYLSGGYNSSTKYLQDIPVYLLYSAIRSDPCQEMKPASQAMPLGEAQVGGYKRHIGFFVSRISTNGNMEHNIYPGIPKTFIFSVFPVKTIVLLGIFN